MYANVPVATPTTYQKIAVAMLEHDPRRHLTPEEASNFVTQRRADELDEILHARPIINAAIGGLIDSILAHCIDPKVCDNLYSQKEHVAYMLMNRVYHGMVDDCLNELQDVITNQLDLLYHVKNSPNISSQNELCIEAAAKAHERWVSLNDQKFCESETPTQYRHLQFWQIGAVEAENFWMIPSLILHDIGCSCDPETIQDTYDGYAFSQARRHILGILDWQALSTDQILLELVRGSASYAAATSPRGCNPTIYAKLRDREFIYDIIFPQLEARGMGMSMIEQLLSQISP